MRCFNSTARPSSPTRQSIHTVLTECKNLRRTIQEASHSGRHVGPTHFRSIELLEHLKERLKTRSGPSPDVYRERLSQIEHQFNTLVYPITQSVVNEQSNRSSVDR